MWDETVRARCPSCRRSNEVRAEFGCDAPAQRPVLRITCPRCSGTALDCARCHGSGFVLIYRCPTSHASEDISAVLSAYHMLEAGILPRAGGWTDQTEGFVNAVQVLSAERAVIDREAQQRREAARG